MVLEDEDDPVSPLVLLDDEGIDIALLLEVEVGDDEDEDEVSLLLMLETVDVVSELLLLLLLLLLVVDEEVGDVDVELSRLKVVDVSLAEKLDDELV
ncbi:hypothetical protein PMIN03_011304 [Paraphaeosphaeria minitans]